MCFICCISYFKNNTGDDIYTTFLGFHDSEVYLNFVLLQKYCEDTYAYACGFEPDQTCQTELILRFRFDRTDRHISIKTNKSVWQSIRNLLYQYFELAETTKNNYLNITEFNQN